MWILRGNAEADEKVVFRLGPGTDKTLGRIPQADFIVGASLVSRLHCRFTVGDTGQLEVEDLGSTNGTWVNDQRVTRAPLSAGDRVRLGQLELLVERQ